MMTALARTSTSSTSSGSSTATTATVAMVTTCRHSVVSTMVSTPSMACTTTQSTDHTFTRRVVVTLVTAIRVLVRVFVVRVVRLVRVVVIATQMTVAVRTASRAAVLAVAAHFVRLALVLLLQLHSSILEPDLDLALGQVQDGRQLDATRTTQVARVVEFLLELDQLGACVGGAGTLGRHGGRVG